MATFQPVYPKPQISKEEYDRLDFWDIYLDKIHAIIPNEDDRRALSYILVSFYECGDYETALRKLTAFVEAVPSAIDVAWPYLKCCRNVCGTIENPADEDQERSFRRWLSLRAVLPYWLFKFFFRPRPTSMRCKYCGRYARYIHPNDGVAYFGGVGGNNCNVCNRGYPMPSLMWDSVGGQAHMFYRRSVTDRAFYEDIKQSFDVVNVNDEQFGGTPAPGWLDPS